MDEFGIEDPGSGDRAAALEALERYRERRQGGSTGARECLLERATVADEEAAGRRRREELVGHGTQDLHLSRELAEFVYDLAWEEGLEPAFAFELVGCGVRVCDLDEEGEDVSASVQGAPEWIADPTPTAAARRERQLRLSFRRLKRLLDERPTTQDALIAFVDEPDVEAS